MVKTLTVEKSRLNRIGIDRMVINGFTISNFDKLKDKIKIESKDEKFERVKMRNHLFNLNYELKIGPSQELYAIASLEVNPNKFIDGHNLYNSGTERVKEVFNKICDILKKDGIELDISEAKIKEIEVNLTYEKKYSDLEDVMRLIRRANYMKAFQYLGTAKKDSPKEIDVIRSTYLNFKKNTANNYAGKTIKFYDKSYELLFEQEIAVDIPLTRIEVLLRRDYYRGRMKKLGFDNSLEELLKNSEAIEKIFRDSLEHEILKKTKKYIYEELKPNLLRNFLSFRRNEKLKRIERKKLKASNKDIPDLYREERGVFGYLDRNSWIFDRIFLYELVETQIESKHRKIYREQISKKFSHIDGNGKYIELLETVFGTDFFSPTKPK